MDIITMNGIPEKKQLKKFETQEVILKKVRRDM